MNEETREQVMNENNDAQTILTTLLNTMEPTETSELIVSEVLSGNIDLSILSTMRFENIRKIAFEKPGQLTNITNIPESVKILQVNEQLLKEFSKLPNDLEELYISNNMFTKFDCKDIPKLRVLHISNNELTHLEHLPESLEILECENNQLSSLNLANCVQLKELVCSNNPILALQHVPPCITKLEMENNPFIEIDQSEPNEQSTTRIKKRMNYLESFNEYLKLKRDYEMKLKKAKKTAYQKGVSKRDRRQKIDKVKVPCVNCKRNVGTLFSIKDNKYIAICGDKNQPCKLNIKLFKGEYHPLEDIISTYEDALEDDKGNIIETKMNSIFKYLDDQLSNKYFEDNLKDYEETVELLKEVEDHYEDIHNNFEKKEQVQKKQQQIYDIQENINMLMDEFKKTGNREVLIACINVYRSDLVPALECLRQLKYGHMYVDINDKVPPHSILVQHLVSAHTKDYIYGQQPKVEHFVIEK